MPKNSFLQAIFPSPKYSLAPIEQNNKGTLKIGQVVPVFARLVNTGESAEVSLSHLVRFMPTKAPTMEGYKVTFDAFAVPLSCLGYAERKERDIMDFFNVKTNGGEVVNPFSHGFEDLSKAAVVDGVRVNSVEPFFRPGLLGDYLNFPSMKAFRDKVREWINTQTPLFDGPLKPWVALNVVSDGLSYIEFIHRAYMGVSADDFYTIVDNLNSPIYRFKTNVPFVSDSRLVTASFLDSDSVSDLGVSFGFETNLGLGAPLDFNTCRSLLGYILENYPAVANYYSYVGSTPEDAQTMGENMSRDVDLNYLDVLYKLYRIDAQSIYEEWFNMEVMPKLLFNPDLVNYNGDTLMDLNFLPNLFDSGVSPVDASYFAAYWKIISDWYINTNIDGNPDDFFLSKCQILSDSEPSTLGKDSYIELTPFNRRWDNDIFTSAVPMAQVQNVRIPVNGTIPDLREANAFQRLVDIFRNTGNRLRDVIYGMIGIRPSALSSEMSQPIGTLSSWLGVQSVLQTSETSMDSPQAAYAGIATDSSDRRHMFKYINNDEPTPVMLMVLMSVTQNASYMQGFPRKFFRDNIYDFAIPQLANIGEQEITNKEIFFDWTGSANNSYDIEGIFGFNRRYYDWFYDAGNEVHGEFRDSLDYWHGARIFDGIPLLNPEFIEINSDKDHLQRGFANTSESAPSIVYNVRFDGAAVVALPRYVQYNL